MCRYESSYSKKRGIWTNEARKFTQFNILLVNLPEQKVYLFSEKQKMVLHHINTKLAQTEF